MSTNLSSKIILLVDDDEGDRMLMQGALEESTLPLDMNCVSDGEELMNYLNRTNRYCHLGSLPLPGLIILDLNMPGRSGLELLKELKESTIFNAIPIVVMTTSEDSNEATESYKLGADSFITKPDSFDNLVEVLKTLGNFWFTEYETQ